MSFYQDLSQYYDEIFAASPEEMAFIGSLINGRDRLLDLGCGNGNKAVLLSGPRQPYRWGGPGRDHDRPGLSQACPAQYQL